MENGIGDRDRQIERERDRVDKQISSSKKLCEASKKGGLRKRQKLIRWRKQDTRVLKKLLLLLLESQ